MAQMVIFPGPRQARLEEVALEPMRADSVQIRTVLSLVSTGTETIQYAHRFAPDSRWAQSVTYPYRPGYACVGVVEKTGPAVTRVTAGDRVVVRGRHASHHVTAEEGGFGYAVVPPEIDDEHAVWFALAKIAFAGALAADLRLGRRVLVVGAGPVGQMATRWAVAAGCRVVTVDPLVDRLSLALAGGATATVADTLEAGAASIRDAFGGHRPEIVIDSTGNAAALAEALAVVADHGRIVILGTAASDTAQHLTSDVHFRGVTVTGAHDNHTLQDQRWDNDLEIFRLFFQLVGAGRFSLHGLATHRYAPAQCSEAYELMEEYRGKTLGVLFDWATQDM